MAKNKTVETEESVSKYLNLIKDEKRNKDCLTIIELIEKHTKLKAKMWGTAIIGFGNYNYKYESGREGSAPLVAFASRANAITFYLSANFDKREELLSKFGNYKTGKGCIYIQKLEDIDTGILVKMILNTIQYREKELSNKC